MRPARTAAITILLISGTALGTDRFWVGPDGGIFGDPKNWIPGGVPVGNDQAFFDLAPPLGGDVVFFANRSHHRLVLRQGIYLYDLNGFTYTLAASPPGAGVIVGDQVDASPFVTLLGGTLVCEDAIVAAANPSIGQVLVNDATWSVGGMLDVGQGGNGSLDIRVGGLVEASSARFAAFPGSFASLDIADAGSTMSVAGNLLIGVAATTFVTIDQMGSLSGGYTALALNPGAIADMFVEGDWVTNGALDVGLLGAGEFTAIGGAVPQVTGNVRIGANAGSDGFVDVLGSTSGWTIGGQLDVATHGMGELYVGNGTVSAAAAHVGREAGSDGTLTINGPLGTLDLVSTLRVGANGTGVMTVSNGATVTSANLATIGDGASGDGLMTLTGAGSTWTNLPGSIDVGDLGTGELIVADGGIVTTGSMNVNESGALAGDGLVDANVTNRGVVRPGLSAGELTIDGTYLQTADGLLDVEIGGTGAGSDYDRLTVTGPATIDGAIDVTLMSGFVPAIGDSFDLLLASTVSGTFASEALPALPADRAWDLSYTSNRARLDVVENDVTFRVWQWNPGLGDFELIGSIEPYETDLSIEDWYSLGVPNQAQQNIPPGEGPDPVNDASHVFLISSAIDGLHVAFLHDRSVIPLGGVDGGTAETAWMISGDPDGAAWVVMDDGSEASYTGAAGDSLFTADQAWGNFSDGGVIGPLDGAAWSIETAFTDVGGGPTWNGITQWIANSSTGVALGLVLEEDRPVRIEVGPAGPCPDVTGDGMVDVSDLTAVIVGWGTPAADVTGDDTTDVADLVAVITGWGPCT